MRGDMQLRPVETIGRPAAVPAETKTPTGAGLDPYQLLRRALRGWYMPAVGLGLLLGALGALAGWNLGRAEYRSEGLVRLAYEVPAVMQEREYRTPVEIFQAFLQSQQALLSSRRLVDLALQEPAWQATGRGVSPATIEEFAENLKVEHRLNTDYLRILYTDRQPAVAAAGVNAVIGAYSKIYNSQHDQLQQQGQRALEERRQQLQAQLDGLRAQTGAIAKEAGAGGAERLYEVAVQQVTKLETTLTDIRVALVLAEGQGTARLSTEQIATLDPVMRGYLTDRDRLEDQLQQMRLRRFMESHPQVQEVKKALDTVNARILKHAEEYRRMQEQSPLPGAPAGGGGAAVLAGKSVQSLQAEEAGIRKLYEEAKERMVSLAAKQVQLDALKVETDKVGQELALIKHRIEVLTVESAGMSGRLSVISPGPEPIAPFRDRRLHTAMAGGLAGLCLPVGLLMLLGLINTRYRYCDEPEADLAAQVPLLGILPTLPEHMGDQDRAADAAHCVHQIRVMLQMKNNRERPVYLMSSASPGEGKTSLTAALGLSFAASGAKVLLIDADFVGQRLTIGFDAGHLTGLHEAVMDRKINGHVKRTAHAGLWILPAGQADMLHAGTLSSGILEHLLSQVRKEFDVVLIDSGPILGSVEAAVLAGLVDGVILTIARNQQRPLVEKALRQFQSLGARLAGVVFNRAETTDFYRSVHSASVRSARSLTAMVRRCKPEIQDRLRLGPLVESVVSFLPPGLGGEGVLKK